MRGRVHPSVRPSVGPSVRKMVSWYFRRRKIRLLGASCAVYPALFNTLNFFYFFLRSEFKSKFKRRLEQLGIKTYHLRTSVFPKVAPVERVIKSCKSIYFSILYHFKTLNPHKAIQLTTAIYNQRKNSALFYYSPQKTHFDSHTSSIVARKSIKRSKERQKQIRNIFSTKPNQTLNVGDKVVLRRRKHTFYKENLLHHPRFEDTPTEVTSVDRRYLPYTYVIKTHPNKKWYFFDLRRVTEEFGNKITNADKTTPPKIYVKNFIEQNQTFLRSNKKFPHKQRIFYIIERGDKTEQVERETLLFFKRVLGNDILSYDSIFQEKQNRHLIV